MVSSTTARIWQSLSARSFRIGSFGYFEIAVGGKRIEFVWCAAMKVVWIEFSVILFTLVPVLPSLMRDCFLLL